MLTCFCKKPCIRVGQLKQMLSFWVLSCVYNDGNSRRNFCQEKKFLSSFQFLHNIQVMNSPNPENLVKKFSSRFFHHPNLMKNSCQVFLKSTKTHILTRKLDAETIKIMFFDHDLPLESVLVWNFNVFEKVDFLSILLGS